jgi:hypothetical protein
VLQQAKAVLAQVRVAVEAQQLHPPLACRWQHAAANTLHQRMFTAEESLLWLSFMLLL